MFTSIKQPTSICILRLSAIGDVCHAVAAVQAIQQRWPDAKITWIIGKVEVQLLHQLPNIEFVVFDKKAGLKAYYNLQKQFRGQKFDILLHMQIAFRASLVSLCISAREKWGFNRKNSREIQWLFINRQIRALKQPHVAEGFWAFAEAICNDKQTNHLADKPHWHMPIGDDDQEWLNIQLSGDELNNSSDNTLSTKPIFVVSPAASKVQRNWLTERYSAIADHAYTRGYRVILVGGPSPADQQLGDAIVEAANHSLLNLTGKTSLTQLLAVIKNASFIIAPDSGPAHMATTVNTPVIGLYAHSNPKRTGPYLSLENTVSIYAELLEAQTVKTIDDQRWGKRVKGEQLMQQISLESVIEVFNRLDQERTNRISLTIEG